jgi:hypothetical protein
MGRSPTIEHDSCTGDDGSPSDCPLLYVMPTRSTLRLSPAEQPKSISPTAFAPTRRAASAMEGRLQNQTEARLKRIRGSMPSKRHDARTIAALTSNPGCHRRAVLDAAGVDKEYLARQVGFPLSFGQSPFAIARGNVFEKRVTDDECTELLRLLREDLGMDLPEVSYADLGSTDGAGDELRERYARSRSKFFQAIRDANGERGGGEASLFVHPLLRMLLGRRPAGRCVGRPRGHADGAGRDVEAEAAFREAVRLS